MLAVEMRRQYLKICGGVRMVSGVGVFSYIGMGGLTQLGTGPYGSAFVFKYPMHEPAGSRTHIPGVADRTFKKVGNTRTQL